MGRPRVATIVVTYNNADQIAACLSSIRSSLASIDIHVVDNASADNTCELVKRITLVDHFEALECNIGFARAVNRAAARVSAANEFIFLLNPDAVLHDGALDRLIEAATAAPNAGLWGGRMFDRAGQVDVSSCLPRPSLWQALAFALCLSQVRALDPDRLGAWDRATDREVPALTGGALLIDHQLWRSLEGFNPGYFMYGEDVDLCLRAREIGARPRYVGAFTYTHVSGSSSPDKGAYLSLIMCGKATLFRRHLAPVSSVLAARLLVVGVALRALLESVLRPGRREWRAVWRRRVAWERGWEDALAPDRVGGA